MSVITTQAPPDQLYAALVERFSQGSDGFWYPIQPGRPLVRLEVSGSRYRIDRRATPDQPWMSLVEGVNGDFDAEAFKTWADDFPLVCC